LEAEREKIVNCLEATKTLPDIIDDFVATEEITETESRYSIKPIEEIEAHYLPAFIDKAIETVESR